MTERRPIISYLNGDFLGSRSARPLRILAEYIEPLARFERLNIDDTIVLFGSSRIRPPEEGTSAAAELSRYYEDARDLSERLTIWSKGIDRGRRRFVICSGGGPGIMEAANRGASDAKGVNIGLNIEIPTEQDENPYITRELAFEFHYFFMRKFWFVYLAKAIVIFPGGFGTIDELFEVLTLVQTRKLHKKLPIVLFGTPFWDEIIDFDALRRFGVIGDKDLELMFQTDSVDEAFDYITTQLTGTASARPGGKS